MTKTSRRPLMLLIALALLAAGLSARPRTAEAAGCAGMEALVVPGAERQKVACAADLTTAGAVAAGLTQPSDWALLNHPGTLNPAGVPGVQIDGYFPDTPPPAPYTPNPFNGWNHDAQFVIRLPDNWNGGLVIAPPPGNRRQYSSDFVIGDWVLARGYAYASTDKGNWTASFFLDGQAPGDAIAEWHSRVAELTRAARAVVRQQYGRPAQTVLLFGISNGGYQVRYAVENYPGLFDGGVDWEGTQFTREGPHLLTYLPVALRSYPVYANAAATPEQREAARQAMLAAGFAPGSEFLWPLHYNVYWDLTQRIYREEFDPEFDGPLLAGVPYCASGTPNCDADYDYASRPASVKDAVARVAMTGKLKRPLITVQGSLDSLITPAVNAQGYADLIAQQRRSALHRLYTVESGQHVDGFVPAFGDALEPVLPCARAAFVALEQWVATGAPPPPSGTIGRASVDVNSCALP
jgi:dienelactone hydrolase